MAKKKSKAKPQTRSVGVASRRCPQISKKTGKKIRSKKQRSDCMKRAMKGGASGKKKAKK